MIPVLLEKTATTFTSNGITRLSDCTRCIVTEERNGIYELEMDYPVTGKKFDEIQIGRIISCSHDEGGEFQPFDIYEVSQPIDGIVTFYAHHISYRLNEIVVSPFTATSCATAMAALSTNSIGSNPFSFYTDKDVTADYEVNVPSSLRGLLGGEENSILDVFGGGEYKFDRYGVSLLTRRGTDTEVSIRYGKNLVDYENELDYSNSYNAVVPYWRSESYDETTGESVGVTTTLPEWIIDSGNVLPSGRTVAIPMDLSGEFEEAPTASQLREKATSELASSYGWLPTQNMTVNFIQLWQTDEYADLAPLQKVKLCDTVLVDVPMYNVSKLRIKVVKVVWNVLLDRYDEMELGAPSATLASVISNDYGTKFDNTRLEIERLHGLLVSQIDAKIETWTQTSNPAAEWTTADLREQHNGDLWLYTGIAPTTIDGVTIYPQGVYQYNVASGKWDAYSSTSSNLFDIVDGKSTIFYGPNTGTYVNVQTGDYLVDGASGKTYRWNGSAWVLLLDYQTYTDTKTADSKVTRTEVQYCLSDSNSSFVAYGSWSTTMPAYVAGKYYWTRTVEYYGDGTNNAGSVTPVFFQSGQTAVETKNAFESNNNHFWHDSSGAYVTESDNSYATGYATRITNSGILQSYNNNLMSSWTNSGINFYESGGGSNPATVAAFGNNGAELGNNSATSIIKLCKDSLRIYGEYLNNNNVFRGVIENTKTLSDVAVKKLFLKNSDKVNILMDESTQDDYTLSLNCNGATIELNSYVVGGETVGVSPGLAVTAKSNSSDTSPKGLSLIKNSSGSYGLYSVSLGKWIIALNSSNHAVIPTIPDNTTTTGTANVHCNANGVLYLRTSSSKRFKRDIENVENAEALYDVQVRQFKYKDDYIDKDDQRFDTVVPGFIVEELKEVYPIAVDYDGDKPKDWNERYMIPPMLKLIQDQHKQIEDLTRRIEALERATK